MYEEARIQVANEYDTAEGGELDRLHAAQKKLREEVQKLNALQQRYYESVRSAWKAITGTDLPPYEWKQVTADRALWQSVGGYSSTQFNGLTFTQLANGESRNGLTLDDLWAQSTKAYDDNDWMSLADDVMKRASRMCLVMTAQADRSQPRYARIPQGPTCGFCIMLASRGFVYKSAESAGKRYGVPWNSFHRNCDCVVMPEWGDTKLDGYDYEGMRKRYEQCRDEISRTLTREAYERDLKAHPEHGKRLKYNYNHTHATKVDVNYDYWVMKQIVDEMNWHDQQWLYDGTIPKDNGMTPAFVSERARVLKKQKKEMAAGDRKEIELGPSNLELHTAHLLALNGVRPVFQVDHLKTASSSGDKYMGLPDLADGTEIKTLDGASSKNTVDKHIHNALKVKHDVRRLVIDNSINDGLSDDKLENFILRNMSIPHHDAAIYMITKEKKLVRVR